MIREKHIDGIKGLACMAIMIGHLTGIYKYAQDVKGLYNPVLEIVKLQPFLFVLDENNWVALFCVLSGYLLWHSGIYRVSDVIKKTVNRFVRLMLPIMGATIFVFSIYRIIGFYNYKTGDLLINEWYQRYYQKELTIISIIVEPLRTLILGAYDINPPYWMIFYLYRASVIIYVAKFCTNMAPKQCKFLIILIFGTVSYFVSSTIGVSCFMGVLYGEYKDIEKKEIGIYFATVISLILTGIISYSLIRYVFLSCFWICIIILISRNTLLKKFFESRCMFSLGKISFGLYSLHFPVMCSIGALLIINCTGEMGLITIFVICSIVSVILAVIYRFIIEKPSKILQKKIGDFMNCLVHTE